MNEPIKNNVKPLYEELQGYLSQAPVLSDDRDTINSESVWKQYNHAVRLLSEVTEKKYDRFLIETEESSYGRGPFIRLLDYRQKLGGLISHLHAEYFSNDPAPFSGKPSTIITQTQLQTQSVHIQMLLEFQSLIDRQLPHFQKGSSERSFLENLKSKLSTVSNVVELFSLCTKLAKDAGVSLETLHRIFTSLF